MRHTLPNKKSCLCFQDDSFFTYLSTIGLQVLLLFELALIGIPKCTKGKVKTLQCRIPAKALTSISSTPIAPHLLLKKLTFKPVANSKHLNKLLITTTFSIDALPIKIVLSAYWSNLTSTLPFPTTYPLKIPLEMTILIKPFNPSTITMNRKGDKGLPCLRPLCILNSLAELPFAKIDIELEHKHSLIHKIHFMRNPNLWSMYNRKSQETKL